MGLGHCLGIEDKMQYSPCPLEIRQKHRRAVATGPDFGPNHMYSTVSSDWKANSLLRHFHAKKRTLGQQCSSNWMAAHFKLPQRKSSTKRIWVSTETGRPKCIQSLVWSHIAKGQIKQIDWIFETQTSDSLCIFKHIPKHILYIEQWMGQTLPHLYHQIASIYG